jgi:hypothetical protein
MSAKNRWSQTSLDCNQQCWFSEYRFYVDEFYRTSCNNWVMPVLFVAKPGLAWLVRVNDTFSLQWHGQLSQFARFWSLSHRTASPRRRHTLYTLRQALTLKSLPGPLLIICLTTEIAMHIFYLRMCYLSGPVNRMRSFIDYSARYQISLCVSWHEKICFMQCLMRKNLPLVILISYVCAFCVCSLMSNPCYCSPRGCSKHPSAFVGNKTGSTHCVFPRKS